MLDKMFGVSPPLKGEAPDSKPELNRDLRGTSKSDYKKEFEKALSKKQEKKEETPKSEELRADKKEKKSLGGIKKKVTEDDDKMVSNLMASNESKVEIADSKIENPPGNKPEIEIDIPQITEASGGSELLAAAHMQAGSLQPKQLPVQPLTAEAPTLLPKLVEISPGLTDAAMTQQPQLQNTSLAQEQVQPQDLNLEAELEAAVGFSPDAGLKQSSGELLQKMKNFEGEKNPSFEKAQSFEQSILNRLQNEQVKNVSPFTEQNFSQGENPSRDSGQESGPMKDLKSDLQDSLPLSAGQTHGDFKSHLGPVAPGAPTIEGKLEEHREANVKEIMNQAQYLVTKGGGEVSVKMSPEGLGELHLKVIFQDGKLNVEMQTQNKDIKKLVEESLSELKSGLAAHRLSLEHVKINTVNATNADNNTQFQSNLNQGGSQEHAREQMRDFQNMNNQSEKKSTQSTSAVQPLGPRRGVSASAATAVNAMRTYGGTKGATINRVA